MYKLRDIPTNSSQDPNDHSWFTFIIGTEESEEKRSKLQADFISYLSVASTVPSLLFLVVNTYLANR